MTGRKFPHLSEPQFCLLDLGQEVLNWSPRGFQGWGCCVGEEEKEEEEEIFGLLQLGFPAAWIFCSPELLLS